MKKSFCFFIYIILILQTLANNTIDPDYWARLLQGNAFWQFGHIMKQDIYSYTPTHLWIDHEWGSSVIFSFIQNHFGFTGILISKIILLYLIFFLIFKTIKLQTEKINNGLNIILFGLMIYAMPSLTQSGFRCHFFTFFFFTLFLYILETVRKKQENKLLTILPPLMLLWCNMHGGCVSGLGLLLLYGIGEALNKRPFKHYLYTLIAAFVVMFINPYGVEYVQFIFTAATMPRPYITEWRSPFLHPIWHFMLWFKALSCFYLAIILKNIKMFKTDYTKLIILLACLFVAVKSVKSSPFFIISATIFLYEDILLLLPKANAKIVEITGMIAFITAGILSINSFFFLAFQPYKTVEFIKVNELKGNILAPMEMGSYIAYKLYPNNLIYMDGRYEEVYFKETKDLADNFYNTKEDWQEVLKDSPDYIIAPIDATVNDLLSENKDYKLIWRDEDNWLYALNKNVKTTYKTPSNDIKYYIKTAFETN